MNIIPVTNADRWKVYSLGGRELEARFDSSRESTRQFLGLIVYYSK